MKRFLEIKKLSKVKVFLISFLLLLFCTGSTVFAKDLNLSVMDREEFSDVDQVLDDVLTTPHISFKEFITDLITGNTKFNLETIQNYLLQEIFGQAYTLKKSFIPILIIAIAASMMSNLSSLLESRQITDISYYIVYMLMLAVLVESFVSAVTIANDVLDKLVMFMKTLMPAYFLTVALSSGVTTATVFYQFVLMLITAVNWLFLKILIPMVNIYVILVLVNNLAKEDYLSKFADLIKMGIEWILKVTLTGVIGFNVLQGLISPAVDSFKATVLNKTISVIPGVGNAVNAVTEMVVGSAVLIKNGVGVAAIVFILILCALPMIQLWVFAVAFKLAAAVVQPISDKRMISCIGCIGDGSRLLLKVISTSIVLFLITIAIVTATSIHY